MYVCMYVYTALTCWVVFSMSSSMQDAEARSFWAKHFPVRSSQVVGYVPKSGSAGCFFSCAEVSSYGYFEELDILTLVVKVLFIVIVCHFRFQKFDIRWFDAGARSHHCHPRDGAHDGLAKAGAMCAVCFMCFLSKTCYRQTPKLLFCSNTTRHMAIQP